MMEEQFRRAMLLSRGDLMVFAERPISATVLAITAAILAWSVWSALKRSKPLADEQPE
jgi:TctA family transporter